MLTNDDRTGSQLRKKFNLQTELSQLEDGETPWLLSRSWQSSGWIKC